MNYITTINLYKIGEFFTNSNIYILILVYLFKLHLLFLMLSNSHNYKKYLIKLYNILSNIRKLMKVIIEYKIYLVGCPFIFLLYSYYLVGYYVILLDYVIIYFTYFTYLGCPYLIYIRL
jgi:hypothetical protein